MIMIKKNKNPNFKKLELLLIDCIQMSNGVCSFLHLISLQLLNHCLSVGECWCLQTYAFLFDTKKKHAHILPTLKERLLTSGPLPFGTQFPPPTLK